MSRSPVGTSGLAIPKLIFGSSALGNLYRVPTAETKLSLVERWTSAFDAPVWIDTAGKYGAGLALEEIGRGLRACGAGNADVVISNKLGWKRVPLTGEEPTFEPGVWKEMGHDAAQDISYEGILACWRQGNELFGEGVSASILSVHDPDEYLAAAADESDARARFTDLVGAYGALHDLKKSGKAHAIGVGAKDWRVIRRLLETVQLDWVMIAGSLTLYTHTTEVRRFVAELAEAGVAVINSAVFNAGFLVGSGYFDYRAVSRESNAALFAWREAFFATCTEYDVCAADACVEFALAPRGVVSVAMNTARPERVDDNVRAVTSRAPAEFWTALAGRHLISALPEDLS